MSAAVHLKLRDWLQSAKLDAGARLPPERELAAALSMSRAELRKELQILEVEGRLDRHVGRGTFVRGAAAPAIVDTSRIAALAERTGPHEAMIARIALEPELARLAALHATPRQLADLKRLAVEMRAVTDWESYEDLDAAFHDLIAEATGNPLMHEVSRVVNGVRKAVVWGRLFLTENRPSPDYHSFDEHDEIVAALERRDRAGARDAMRNHIEATLRSMMADD